MIIIEGIITPEGLKDGPSRQLTAQEKQTITSFASVGDDYVYYQGDEPPTEPTLAQLKEAKIVQIDAETESNIVAGFVYDGKLFSMSVNAQINWSNFPNLPSQVFPLTIMSKSDEEYVLLEANKTNFYLTALGHKNGHLQAGNAKKKAVQACQTIEELNQL